MRTKLVNNLKEEPKLKLKTNWETKNIILFKIIKMSSYDIGFSKGSLVAYFLIGSPVKQSGLELFNVFGRSFRWKGKKGKGQEFNIWYGRKIFDLIVQNVLFNALYSYESCAKKFFILKDSSEQLNSCFLSLG